MRGPRLTQAIAREYIRRLGGKFRRDQYGDYRVTLQGAEYYCQHLDDAAGTARIMAGSHQDFDRAEQYLKDDFTHDIAGIRRCLYRETGQLEHCFVPRYREARP